MSDRPGHAFRGNQWSTRGVATTQKQKQGPFTAAYAAAVAAGFKTNIPKNRRGFWIEVHRFCDTHGIPYPAQNNHVMRKFDWSRADEWVDRLRNGEGWESVAKSIGTYKQHLVAIVKAWLDPDEYAELITARRIRRICSRDLKPWRQKTLLAHWRRDPYARRWRFWENTSQPTDSGCREWLGSRFAGRERGPNVRGYGQPRSNETQILLEVYGRNRRVGCHVVAWTIINGPVPDGMCVLHHCDNPPCCEPSHLYIGTMKDNMADRDKRGHYGYPMLGRKHSPETREKMRQGHARARAEGREGGSAAWWAQLTPAEREAHKMRTSEWWAQLTPAEREAHKMRAAQARRAQARR